MTDTPHTERETQHTEATRRAMKARRLARHAITQSKAAEHGALADAHRTIALEHMVTMAAIVMNELTDEASAVALGIPGSRQRLGTIRVLASDVESLRNEIGGAA